MTTKWWYTYRDRGQTLARLISAAFADYKSRFSVPPQAVCVPQSQVELALSLLPEDVEVEGCGGALVGELWIQSPEQTAEPEATPPSPAWTQTAMF